jgi:hypothetical protein
MNKRFVTTLTALIVSVTAFSAQAFAQSPVNINLVAGYAKGNSSFDVVVKDTPGTKLVLYVNDKNPSKATVNKSDWATFHRVKLVNSGKISFTKVVKGGSHGSYEKPINYTRQFVISNGEVNFSVTTPAPVAATPPPAAAPAPTTPAPAPAPTPTCTNGTYVNSAGNTVCSPETSPTTPAGATAQCVDGTYSFSQSRSGTCSHHGGVAQWLN